MRNWGLLFLRTQLAIVLLGGLCAATRSAPGQEPQWIWSPEHQKGKVPQLACHFRKEFQLATPEGGQIEIAADDEYELYLNGKRLGVGHTSGKLDSYDLKDHLARGHNLLAVKVTNSNGKTAGLAVRMQIQDRTRGRVLVTTDASWLTNLRPLPFWYTPLYNDSRWAEAKSFGRFQDASPRPSSAGTELAKTVPVPAPEATTAASPLPDPPEPERLTPPPESQKLDQPVGEQTVKVLPDFQVERLIDSAEAGSLVAMAFNEFGQVVAAREGGGLVLLHDSDQNGTPDRVRPYCDLVKNCGGILCLNGDVFVTGEGPDGLGLYRLSDKQHAGKLDNAQTVLKFRGTAGEYGPHRVALGPDGWLYIALGNQVEPEKGYEDASPLGKYYEGDLLQPRLEDPAGHEPTAKAPGGAILRTDLKGAHVQLIAGGLRNATDVTFNVEGELFATDCGAEFDSGTPWYRPARVAHILPGAEFGWRSGWAKWPDYFIDSLPGNLDTPSYLPTGATFYNHYRYPERFHEALFVADWAQGRISAVTLKRQGSSYAAANEVFLDAAHLNISDLSVGPDGALYFITGGQGAAGGLYRIKWQGQPPPGSTLVGRGLAGVIRQPQLGSAWARQNIATTKAQLGGEWDRLLRGVAVSTANPWRYRTRALDLLQLYGPAPDAELLLRLATAEPEQLRAKVAELMGLRATPEARKALLSLLDDRDAFVRRRACEALIRCKENVPHEKLIALLKSADRREAWAARRLLERLPIEPWREALLAHESPRVVLQASLALLIAQPTPEHAAKVVERLGTLLDSYLSDRDFTDLLRVAQVALLRAQLPVTQTTTLQQRLAEEYPANEHSMNRELVRLLVYLQDATLLARGLEQLNTANVPDVEKLHLALHLRLLNDGWTPGARTQLIEFFDEASKKGGGHSYSQYLNRVSRDFAKSMTEAEARQVLADGARWPSAAVASLYKLPTQLDDETFEILKRLNVSLQNETDLATRRLKVGIVAVLARSADPKCLAYLRERWEEDPERRPAIAMGLAQSPNEENWSYLIRSLPILDGDVAREVLVKLKAVRLAPEEPDYYREVILRGLKLKDSGGLEAVELLEFWSGEKTKAEGDWQAKLNYWQQWYAAKYPAAPDATLPEDRETSKWNPAELLRHLNSVEATSGGAARGITVFQKAQCAKCHRLGEFGEQEGLNLSGITKRMMRKELIESMLYPSHSISPDNVTQTVISAGGRIYSGQVTVGSAGELTIQQADGQQVKLTKEQVEEQHLNRVSDMPAGLLDGLTLQEVTDLVSLLGSSPEELLTQRPDDSVRR